MQESLPTNRFDGTIQTSLAMLFHLVSQPEMPVNQFPGIRCIELLKPEGRRLKFSLLYLMDCYLNQKRFDIANLLLQLCLEVHTKEEIPLFLWEVLQQILETDSLLQLQWFLVQFGYPEIYRLIEGSELYLRICKNCSTYLKQFCQIPRPLHAKALTLDVPSQIYTLLILLIDDRLRLRTDNPEREPLPYFPKRILKSLKFPVRDFIPNQRFLLIWSRLECRDLPRRMCQLLFNTKVSYQPELVRHLFSHLPKVV